MIRKRWITVRAFFQITNPQLRGEGPRSRHRTCLIDTKQIDAIYMDPLDTGIKSTTRFISFKSGTTIQVENDSEVEMLIHQLNQMEIES